MKIGFKPTTADPSVFINNRGLFIALYVGDIIIFGKEEGESHDPGSLRFFIFGAFLAHTVKECPALSFVLAALARVEYDRVAVTDLGV